MANLYFLFTRTFFFIGLVLDQVTGSVESVNSTELNHLVTSEQWKIPVCVLLFRQGTHSQDVLNLQSVIEELKSKDTMPKCKFVKFDVSKDFSSHLAAVPVPKPFFQCYNRRLTGLKFDGRKLKKWMKNIAKVETRKTIFLVNDTVEAMKKRLKTKKVVAVAIPSRYHWETVEKILEQLSDEIQGVLVPPETVSERIFIDSYNVKRFPTVLLFGNERQGRKHRMIKKLEGAFSVTKEKIQLLALVHQIKIPKLTSANFFTRVMDARHHYIPIIVCFYSLSDPMGYSHLHAYERSFQVLHSKLRKKLRFGLCDLSDGNTAHIVSEYMPSTGLHELPMIVLYRAESFKDKSGELQTKIIAEVVQVSVPTPGQLEDALLSTNVFDRRDAKPPMLWSRHMFCSANVSADFCAVGDKPEQFYGPLWNEKYKRKYIKLKTTVKTKKDTNRIWDIPALSTSSWKGVFEKTVSSKSNGQVFSEEFVKKETTLFRTKLVIFIMKSCSYCELLKETFQGVSKLARKRYGSSVFIVNCTSDADICEKAKINGFPTLALFRGFSSKETAACFKEDSTDTHLRLDYQGNYQVDDILSWISSGSARSIDIELRGKGTLGDEFKHVKLTATVTSQALARRYLPRSLEGKYYPFLCFRVLCDRLFSAAKCVATESELGRIDRKLLSKSDLIVTEVTFERQDGAKVHLFKLNYPVESTLNEDDDSKLHLFHNHHRYGLPDNFFCEDNHPLCTETMYRFVLDHHRLPVTHISHESFHARHRNSGVDAVFSKRFPVLIALITKKAEENVAFLENFSNAARQLYRDIICATLDVDEYPHWASRFVPRDYHSNHRGMYGDNIPALYFYPRLCLVNWDTHNEAAFYPNVSDLEKHKNVQLRLNNITRDEILNFVHGYLDNPSRYLIETEIF